MLKTGLASMTFRNKGADEIIEITKRAGLSAIEWASDVHVPPGDIQTAKKIGDMTRAAGLEVSSYGSYYTLGGGEDFELYIQSASALGVSDIRIWAGEKDSALIDDSQRAALVLEAKQISKIAESKGIRISLECHRGTLTDTPESHIKLLSEVDMPNFLTYWQIRSDISDIAQPDDLRLILETGKLTNVHVQSYDKRKTQTLLSKGVIDWEKCIELLKKDEALHYALIETVLNRDEENLLYDANVLNGFVF